MNRALLLHAVVLVPLIRAVKVMLKQNSPDESDETAKASVVSCAVVLAVVSAVVALLVWLLLRPGTSDAGRQHERRQLRRAPAATVRRALRQARGLEAIGG